MRAAKVGGVRGVVMVLHLGNYIREISYKNVIKGNNYFPEIQFLFRRMPNTR